MLVQIMLVTLTYFNEYCQSWKYILPSNLQCGRENV